MSNLPPISFEPVDFTPVMREYSGQGAFRFWCQTVLPLIYDDSLSYYELLNKVVVYLNKTIEDVGKAEDNIDNLNTSFGLLQNEYNLKTFEAINRVNLLLTEFTDLKNYVDNYFDNLDTQAEIEAILDNWVTTGKFNDLLHPIVTPMVQPIVEESVPAAVTSWLEENVEPVGSAVVVDNTLSITGAAADAKVTGDKIKENSELVGDMLQVYNSPNINFQSGFVAASGASGTNTAKFRVTASTMPIIKTGDIIIIKEPYAIYNIVAMNNRAYGTANFSGLIRSARTSNYFIIPEGFEGKYLGFSVEDSTNTGNVDISDRAGDIPNYIKYYSPSDTVKEKNIISSNLYEYNTVDVFDLSNVSTNTTLNGITFNKNSDASWTISGAATADTAKSLVNYPNGLPDFIVPGRRYKINLNGGNIRLQYYYNINESQSETKTILNDTDIIIPQDATGMVVRFFIDRNTTVNETIKYTMTGYAQSNDEELRDIIYGYNAYNVFELVNNEGRTNSGITFTKNSDGTWTITGTATSDTFCNLISARTELPESIIKGREYRLEFNGGTVPVRVYFYNEGGSVITNITYREDATIRIPENAEGIIVRFQVANNTSFDETVKYRFIALPIYGATDGVAVENEYNYYNEYQMNVSPTITTDSNGWLQAIDTETENEDNKTDMSAAIMAMLTSTGYCHLGEGIFYVSGNIDMPSGSTLCGCGEKSIIKLLESVNNGYCVKMRDHCTIKDVRFKGSYSSISPTVNGNRNAIHFTANYDGTGEGGSYTTKTCMISNVWISYFSGSGLYCHNTGINYSQGLIVNNLWISRCYAGVNIDYYSEFHKFTNVVAVYCYIAVINNGGNNNFVNCTFHGTHAGFYINGAMPNAAHGVIDGCTFCHIGSNNGDAILFENVSAGFVISNSQFWYNALRFNDCQSILVSGCEFGRGISNDGNVSASIYVTNGNGIIFSGCLFHLDVTRPPKIEIVNNTKTVFANCYGGESGNIITA